MRSIRKSHILREFQGTPATHYQQKAVIVRPAFRQLVISANVPLTICQPLDKLALTCKCHVDAPPHCLFVLLYRQMREDPQEADSGVRLRQQQQVLTEQQKEPWTQPCGTPAPEGSNHPPPGFKALQETRAAAVVGAGASQSKGQDGSDLGAGRGETVANK